jgi:hypothetical protein
MKIINGSLAGLVLAGILALLPAAAIARGGGGGHGGSGHFGGGHFVGGGHFGGPAAHGSAFHHAGHSRPHFGHGGLFWAGDPFAYDDPYYGYSSGREGGYPVGRVPAESFAPQAILAVQRELTYLGYYHGRTDGLAGPQTEKAVRSFQSVDKLPVTGHTDGRTLKALRIG